jgi:hypothetical protein
MFILCILFSLFIYATVKYNNIRTIENNTKNTQKNVDVNFMPTINNNVLILDKLGYYNFNKNDILMCFLLDCMNHLLFYSNPNYTKSDFFENCSEQDPVEISIFYDEFEKKCLELGKGKMDLTVGEIISYIKKSDIYKNLDKELSLKFKRAILLSKHLNDKTSEKLINNLTIQELNLLTE